MDSKKIISPLLLLLTAFVWGFGFVAQKASMDYIGPFTYNGCRFALGAICVLAVTLVIGKLNTRNGLVDEHPFFLDGRPNRVLFAAGIISGLALFAGASFQQIAIQYTTVGRCSFITALYIVMVPLISVVLKKKIPINAWLAVVIAAVGFYFLCLQPGEQGINLGDLLTLIGSVFWAIQILAIDAYVGRTDGVKMAAIQFIVNALLGLIFALIFETISLSIIMSAAIPILYGGVIAAGLGFTLQIIGQKHTPPTTASLLLSMESVFAVVGGALLLHERLSGRESFGCLLILIGVLLAQIPIEMLRRSAKKKQ